MGSVQSQEREFGGADYHGRRHDTQREAQTKGAVRPLAGDDVTLHHGRAIKRGVAGSAGLCGVSFASFAPYPPLLRNGHP